MPLDPDPPLAEPDRLYRALTLAHRGLSDEESAMLNSRLVLILASQIGDPLAIEEAIALARSAGIQATGRDGTVSPTAADPARRGPAIPPS